jgi:hypothetical protein
MSGNIRKVGTMLATLAMIASMLLVTIPVGAAPIKDVYVKSIGLPIAQPTIGDNITITATIRSTAKTNASCAGVTVTFSAINGSTTLALSVVVIAANTTNTVDRIVNGSWNSTTVVPNAALVYKIKVDLQLTGDTNITNNTMTTTSTIDWKAPTLAVINPIAGAATALIGDDYTATVTVKNIGDADYNGVQTIDVMVGTTTYGSAELNCTTTALIPAATKAVAVVVNTTTFTAGNVNLTASLGSSLAYKVVVFADKVTNVYVTDIAFDPTSGWKGNKPVKITATFKNNGTMDAVDIPVQFFHDATEIIVTPAVTVSVVMGDTVEGSANVTWTMPDSTIAKTYVIMVKADGNNLTKSLVVAPTEHTTLSIVDVAFAPTLVVKDNIGDTQAMTITVTVKNAGDKDAVNAVVTLKLAGTTLNTTMVNVTKNNGQTPVTYTYMVKTPKDTANLSFEAGVSLLPDVGTLLVKNISVPGHKYRAIYEISDLSITPALTQERGLVAKISVSVKNVGDLIGTSVDIKLTAGSQAITTLTVKNIAIAGTNITSYNWSIPATFALSVVKINASIDTLVKSMNYTIIEFKKPVLSVDCVKTKDGKKCAGYSSSAADGKYKTLKVQVVVKNTGTADAKNVNITIKDKSGKYLGSLIVPTIAMGTNATYTVECKIKAGTSTTGTATLVYDGIHADKAYTASSPAASTPGIKVVKTPGFEVVVLVAAVAVAMVILSRRKK